MSRIYKSFVVNRVNRHSDVSPEYLLTNRWSGDPLGMVYWHEEKYVFLPVAGTKWTSEDVQDVQDVIAWAEQRRKEREKADDE